MKNNNTQNAIQILCAKFMFHNGISRRALLLFHFLIFSLIAGLDYVAESHVHSIRSSLESFVAPLKVETHKLLQIPKVVKSFLDIKHENEVLRREMDVLKLTNLQANERIRKLEEITKNLDLNCNFEQFNIVEKVLGFETSVYNSYLIISKTHADITENNIVITPDGLVGVVSSVYEKSAKVLPITNSLTTIPVKSNSGIQLIIRGMDKNELVSIAVQRKELISKLTVGEILYTSGEGGFYKKDIPVAKVTSVHTKKAKIYATPIAQLSNINYVWIIDSNR